MADAHKATPSRAPLVRWRGSSGTWTYARILERDDRRVRVTYGSGPHQVARWLSESEIELVSNDFRGGSRPYRCSRPVVPSSLKGQMVLEVSSPPSTRASNE